MRTDEIHPGDLIAGKYRVRAILGRGHGLLVEGFHTEFDQRVVIKILLAGHGDDREIERFRREARTLAKLESEHVARIIDVGTEPDGSFYLVRQFLEGMDLGTYVAQNGPLPLVDAVLTVLMAAEAVAETHGHGIIVREIQPAHLFLTQRAGGSPLVKITDFGTAKLMRDAAAPGGGGDLTATAMFGLSPYSSPELLRKAKNVDVRTDVWSLGAVFYELLTGHPAFTGESAHLMLQITREEPLAATHLRPELPPEIDAIVGWALAKDVDARFASIHAFAEALRPYASAEGLVLIERIAQITERAKLKRRGGSTPPPSFPSTRPSAAPLAAPAPLPVPSAPPPPPTASAPPPVLTVPALSAPPAFPALSAPPAFPAPRAPLATEMFPQASGSVPPPPPMRTAEESVTDVRPLPGPAVPVPSFVATPTVESRVDAGSSSPPPRAPPAASLPVTGAAPASGSGRKVTWIALALAAVVVPVTVLAVALGPRASGSDGAAPLESASASGSSGPLASAAVTSPMIASAPAPSASSAPSVASAATTRVTVDDPPRPTVTTPPVTTPVPPPVTPTVPPPPPPAANGTLLAVAMGGSCAFSVNGASKGSGASIKVALKPGAYTVLCRPASGAPKSKSVTVKSGETAMAAFKL